MYIGFKLKFFNFIDNSIMPLGLLVISIPVKISD